MTSVFASMFKRARASAASRYCLEVCLKVIGRAGKVNRSTLGVRPTVKNTLRRPVGSSSRLGFDGSVAPGASRPLTC